MKCDELAPGVKARSQLGRTYGLTRFWILADHRGSSHDKSRPSIALLAFEPYVPDSALPASQVKYCRNFVLTPSRSTNRPSGFGFVTMSTPEEAQKAIAAMNGATLKGRNLTVNEARPKEERSGGGGGRDRGGRGGGGGGYNRRF